MAENTDIRNESCENNDPQRIRVSVAMQRVIEGFSPEIEGVFDAEGNYRLRIKTVDGTFETPPLNREGPKGDAGQDGISAYYLIHTKKVVDAAGVVDLGTVIEGLSEADLVELSDEAKYRLCLVRFRKGEDSGRSWHIPALPYFRAARIGKPIAPNTHKIAEEHTWWPVTGREVAWFRGANIVDVLPMGINESQHRFKNSKNLKMRDGVALFKYTGNGGEGWTRVSNIAYVESYLARRNSTDPQKPPYVQISVKM